MELITTIQIGKKGISETTVETVQNHFKNHKNVKLVFLKSSFRDRKKIKKVAEEVTNELGKNYTYRILGFTVFIKKWRKPVRK